MTTSARSPAIAELCIAVAVCAGASALIIDPMRARTSAKQQIVDESMGSADAAALHPALIEAGDDARVAAEAIADRSRLGRDESAIYAQIARLAFETGVRIDQVDPLRRPYAPPRAGGDAAEDRSPARPGDTRIQCVVNAAGSYADVARFLRALSDADWYCDLTSLMIVPVPELGPDEVAITLTTMHFAFDASPMDPLPAGDAP